MASNGPSLLAPILSATIERYFLVLGAKLDPARRIMVAAKPVVSSIARA
jgi:hypothetical protein